MAFDAPRIYNKPPSSEKLLGKSLPYNLDAEKSVIGALLLNDEYVEQISEIIAPKDFYQPSHQLIFQAIIELRQENKRVDLVTLQDALSKKSILEDIGGVSYLLSLQEDIPALGMVSHHARIIKEKAVLRELINSATQIITTCYDQNIKDIDAVLDEAEKIIFQISNKRANQNFIQLNIWLKKTFEYLSDIKSHSKGVTGIPSNFKKLDLMTSGFQKGDLIVLAARPSMGKTGFGLSLASQAALNGYTVGFFSLEMSAEQLTLRLLSAQAGIPHHNIRNGTINTSNDWLELTNVAAQLASLKLFIDDTAMIELMDLRAKARKLKAEHNLSFLVIDYLQLIRVARKHENRHQEVSEISRSLKALAKELEVPIVALAQISRAVDARVDKRPILSDLRESGAIEQDADLIMFLYRDVVYNKDTENPLAAELIIGKQRNGPTGTVMFNFIGELTRFEEADYE